MYLEQAHPDLKVSIWWCPGHSEVRGKEIVDKLAQKTAKKDLQDTNCRPPGIAALQGAIKEWVRKSQKELNTDQLDRLGHNHQGTKHLRSLKKLKKPSVAAMTQLRSGHAPLNHHLFKYQQHHDPACECDTGVETVDHFLFICPRYTTQRSELIKKLKKLKINISTTCLANTRAFKAIAEYCNITWRLRYRWEWETISEEPAPTDLHQPAEWRAKPHRHTQTTFFKNSYISFNKHVSYNGELHPFPAIARGFYRISQRL